MSEILSCGHPASEHPPYLTGYAITLDDRRICYTCADESERARMREADIMIGYLSSDCSQVTTWTGGHLATIRSKRAARVGFGRTTRTYWTAVDANGRYWYGANSGGGMVTTMRIARKRNAYESRNAARQSSATPSLPQPITPKDV